MHISTKRTTFAGDLFTKSAKIIFIKMANNFEEFIKKADRDGIAIEHNVNGWSQVGKDVVLPYVILLMTQR